MSPDPDDMLASALAELEEEDQQTPPPAAVAKEEDAALDTDKAPISSSGITPGFLTSSGDAKKARVAKQKAARAAREAKAVPAATAATGPAAASKEKTGLLLRANSVPDASTMTLASSGDEGASEAATSKYGEQASAEEIAALAAKVTD